VQARERVERYQAAASAPNTVRAYRHDWSEWTSWCAEHSYTPLPASPSVIAAYAAVLADRPVISVPTIERRLAAIGRVHREAEIDPPPTRALEVQRVMTGIRRTLGTGRLSRWYPLLRGGLPARRPSARLASSCRPVLPPSDGTGPAHASAP
jgi:Phage integrase, N-terminal SAM-like domain